MRTLQTTFLSIVRLVHHRLPLFPFVAAVIFSATGGWESHRVGDICRPNPSLKKPNLRYNRPPFSRYLNRLPPYLWTG